MVYSGTLYSFHANLKLMHYLIMAGGTGGHIMPGIAVAKELISRGHSVEWLGSPNGLENKIVPSHGIKLNLIKMKSLRGRGLLRKFSSIINLFFATIRAYFILKKIKPDAVLSMGGYVAAPGGVAAKLLAIRIIVHEQNAISGLTNRMLSKFSDVILCGFQNDLSDLKNAYVTGNPVNINSDKIVAPKIRIKTAKNTCRILVVGGSLGARAINDAILELAKIWDNDFHLRITLQAGKVDLERVLGLASRISNEKVFVEVVEFIQDMQSAYLGNDLLICRSGALTVSEISNIGIASILIPYPHAVDDHQTKNAYFLVEKNAAILLEQKILSAQELTSLIYDLYTDDKLIELAENAKNCRTKNSVIDVVERVIGR